MTARTVTRPPALAGELMDVIAALRRAARRRIAASLAESRLPPGQVELLLVVEAEPGIGVAAAATALSLAANSLSAPVTALVEAGLLRRETDPADRRAARLFLTTPARHRLARWRAARAEVVGEALHRLSPSDRAALAGAVPALRRLRAELRDPEVTR